MVGLGTYQVYISRLGIHSFQKSFAMKVRKESTLRDIVDAALSCGYRFFDTAQVYGNEAALGRIFKELLPKYGLKRCLC